MLNIGLTGGIGSGKSAVSSAFKDLGAVIVDADQISREVVEPGSDGLAEIAETFGSDLLDEHGALNRPALAAVVFGDEAARAKLNAIVHPRVRRRSHELISQAPPEAIIVNDIPLLAEGSMAASFHLVVVVHAPRDVRLQRLVQSRGMSVSDARDRMAAQANDDDRALIADVVLDNSRTPELLVAAVTTLWRERLRPYADNLAAARPAQRDARVTIDEPARRRALSRVAFAAASVDSEARTAYTDETAIEVSPSHPDNHAELVQRLGDAGWFAETGDTRAHLRSSDPRVPLDLHIHAESGR